MSEEKRNKLILGFLFLLWEIILFIFIKKIYTSMENKISFRMEKSTSSLQGIVRKAHSFRYGMDSTKNIK